MFHPQTKSFVKYKVDIPGFVLYKNFCTLPPVPNSLPHLCFCAQFADNHLYHLYFIYSTWKSADFVLSSGVSDPKVLIEGVLFRARYLGSTQLVSKSNVTVSFEFHILWTRVAERIGVRPMVFSEFGQQIFFITKLVV